MAYLETRASRGLPGGKRGPDWECIRVLAQAGFLLLALNLALALMVHHVLHTPGYERTGRLPALLPWALGVNFCFGGLILGFAWFAHWRGGLWRVLTATILVSAVPLLLPRVLRLYKPEQRLYTYGLVYAAFLLFLALVATWYALANAQRASRRALRIWILCSTMLVYAGTTGWMRISTGVTGDEPHYLLLTYSLVHDHDFDLTNNYGNKDYWSFYPALIDPHTLVGRNGTAMLWHDVGLPILLVPGYALARRTGAALEINLMAALLALAVYEGALELEAELTTAILTWAIFAFSAPLIIFASQIFPEVAGAAGALWSVVLFSKFTRCDKLQLLSATGVLLSLLPWLSIRYWMLVGPIELIIFCFIVFGRCAWRLRLKQIGALVVPLCCSLGLFAWFDRVHFGTVLPNAGYLQVVTTTFPQYTHSRPVIGLLGLLLDRTKGLIPLAPVYVIALAGLVAGFREHRWQVACLAAASASYLVFMGFSQYWMGGWGPPGRYPLVAGLLWAPAAALVLRRPIQRWILVTAGSWTALIALAYTAFPQVRYPYMRDLSTSTLDLLVRSHLGLHYDVIFPSLIRTAPTDYYLTAVWLALITACVVVLACPELRSKSRGTRVAKG